MTWCSRSPSRGEMQGTSQRQWIQGRFHELLVQYVYRILNRLLALLNNNPAWHLKRRAQRTLQDFCHSQLVDRLKSHHPQNIHINAYKSTQQVQTAWVLEFGTQAQPMNLRIEERQLFLRLLHGPFLVIFGFPVGEKNPALYINSEYLTPRVQVGFWVRGLGSCHSSDGAANSYNVRLYFSFGSRLKCFQWSKFGC